MTGRPRFDRELTDVHDMLLRTGIQVEQALRDALHALTTWDSLMARRVISLDGNIDAAQMNLAADVLLILATQQPVGRDLRLLQAAVLMMGELERMGDYAKQIARATLAASNAPLLVSAPARLQTMGYDAIAMLSSALDAFSNLDCEQARSLAPQDTCIDDLEDRIRADLLADAQDAPATIPCVVQLIRIARILERVADRATNIGERVIYLVTCRTESLNP